MRRWHTGPRAMPCCRDLSAGSASLACAAHMPTRFLRPCLALLAVLLSAFGVSAGPPRRPWLRMRTTGHASAPSMSPRSPAVWPCCLTTTATCRPPGRCRICRRSYRRWRWLPRPRRSRTWLRPANCAVARRAARARPDRQRIPPIDSSGQRPQLPAQHLPVPSSPASSRRKRVATRSSPCVNASPSSSSSVPPPRPASPPRVAHPCQTPRLLVLVQAQAEVPRLRRTIRWPS